MDRENELLFLILTITYWLRNDQVKVHQYGNEMLWRYFPIRCSVYKTLKQRTGGRDTTQHRHGVVLLAHSQSLPVITPWIIVHVYLLCPVLSILMTTYYSTVYFTDGFLGGFESFIIANHLVNVSELTYLNFRLQPYSLLHGGFLHFHILSWDSEWAVIMNS